MTDGEAIPNYICEKAVRTSEETFGKGFGRVQRGLENVVFVDGATVSFREPKQERVVTQASPLGRVLRLLRHERVDEYVTLTRVEWPQ